MIIMNTFFRISSDYKNYAVKNLLFICLFALLITTQCSQKKTKEVNFTGLLDEMVDLERLTFHSEAEYKTIQFSSYDRRSIHPFAPGWFENEDGFGNEPLPGFEKTLAEPDSTGTGVYLICDVQQAGAIVRLWTASITGSIKMYLDQTDVPFYDGPAEDFFWKTPFLISGEEMQQGLFRQYDALYLPVPFSKRCRIEWTGRIQDPHFYHVGMRLYPENTKVHPLNLADTVLIKNELFRIRNRAGKMMEFTPPVEFPTIALEPGKKYTAWKSEGTGCISQFSVRPGKDAGKYLLNIYFDGSETPQVHAPVSAFFASGQGLNPARSLPITVDTSGWMTCRFVMPYRDSARIELINHSSEPTEVSLLVETGAYTWIDGSSMHFRARWKNSHKLHASGDEVQDIPYLFAMGKGRLAGAASFVYNPSNVPTSWGNWWGEGDEKIFVSGESFPSFFGTGSEDYYNYSWSSSAIFSYPYCGQPRNDGPGNRGFVTNFRWHILDDIPFDESIAFLMELRSHGPVPGFSYGRIVYFYALPETLDDVERITGAALSDPVIMDWSPAAYGGAAGYSFRQAENAGFTGDHVRLSEGHLWSGGKFLEWKPLAKGEKLSFYVDLEHPKEGSRIGFTMSKSPSGGKLSLMVNGSATGWSSGDTLNPESEYHTVLDNFFSKPVHLKKGRNEITLVLEDDRPDRILGIDFLWFRE